MMKYGYRGELITGSGRQQALDGDPYGEAQPVGFVGDIYQEVHWTLTPEPAPLEITHQETAMARTFTVTDSFKSEETQSEYVAGLSYTARDEDEKLLGLIDKWIEEGKVREGGPSATVSGSD